MLGSAAAVVTWNDAIADVVSGAAAGWRARVGELKRAFFETLTDKCSYLLFQITLQMHLDSLLLKLCCLPTLSALPPFSQ